MVFYFFNLEIVYPNNLGFVLGSFDLEAEGACLAYPSPSFWLP